MPEFSERERCKFQHAGLLLPYECGMNGKRVYKLKGWTQKADGLHLFWRKSHCLACCQQSSSAAVGGKKQMVQ